MDVTLIVLGGMVLMVFALWQTYRVAVWRGRANYLARAVLVQTQIQGSADTRPLSRREAEDRIVRRNAA